MATTAPATQPPSPSTAPDQNKPADAGTSAQLLKTYYGRLFPYEILHSWLSYDPSTVVGAAGLRQDNDGSAAASSSSSVFARREFSMTIEPVPGNEIYIRYQSFRSRGDLAEAIIKRNPTKIDIGAVFNHPPKDSKSLPPGKLQTQERELVFDIDLTDYDEVRHCGCTGAKICDRCWTFMGMAVAVMEEGLRKDFGFRHIAWFYSGRRGVHCWVCDPSARALTNEARSAVATYFEVNLGSDKDRSFHLPSPLHPMLARAYKILEPQFVASLLPEEGHGLLATLASSLRLLETLPEPAHPVAIKLKDKWGSSKDNTTPEEKWNELKAALLAFTGGGGKKLTSMDRVRIDNWPVETVFRHTYPRLDINVSKMQNHLLKSPFCVHPKTGRVCVPVPAAEFAEFDPFRVPTVKQLMDELDAYEGGEGKEETEKAKGKGRQRGPPGVDWRKTSLREPYEKFQRTFLAPLLKEERAARKRARESRAALVGDF